MTTDPIDRRTAVKLMAAADGSRTGTVRHDGRSATHDGHAQGAEFG